MKPSICLVALVSLILLAAPAFAAGNIYLTGHDLDFHCAFQTAPTQCNAFKIAIALARAGAPDPNKPVLFLDEGMSAAAASAFGKNPGDSELAFAAQNIGFTAFQVVDPTDSETFTDLSLTTSTYSAIVVASHETCGGCDNTNDAVTAINGRIANIQDFSAQGGGLVYLAGASGEGYYASVPTAYAVNSTSSTFPGNPRYPTDCISTPTTKCYQRTPAGKSLGLTNADANCCETHNSFAPPNIITAPTLDSAANPDLISAETDGTPTGSESAPNDETLYAVGASAGTQAAVLTFTPTQTSQTGTFNCTSNQVPCPDADAHSMKFTVGSVSNSFTIVLTATEVQGDGICQSGDPQDPTDYDCRFVTFFGQPAAPSPYVKVPFCYPYSHGNCVFYDVTGAPPITGFYSGGVREYIAWNNVFPTPAGYLNTPHMYDDPSDDANNCACYPTTPGFPYSPEDNQYVFDITTFFTDNGGQVGKDPGTGGKTPTFNQFGIAFPIDTGLYRWLSPLSASSTSSKKGTIPLKFQLRDAAGHIVSNALTPPNFVNFAVLDSNGVSQPIVFPGGSTRAFVYDPSKQQYQVNISASPYTIGMVYTIVVNSNLFSQQQRTVLITK
jgi:hypothetical protein